MNNTNSWWYMCVLISLTQIDLRFEAQNIERFQKNFKGLQHVKFPTPLRPFVTRTVLVETYEVKMAVLLIVLILYIWFYSTEKNYGFDLCSCRKVNPSQRT